MKCFTISVKGNVGIRVVEFKKDEVNTVWKEIIGTDLLDRAIIDIGDEQYLAVVDDVGKLRKNPITSVVWKVKTLMGPMVQTLVGNVVIHRISHGNIASLTPADIKNLESHIVEEEGYRILMG